MHRFTGLFALSVFLFWSCTVKETVQPPVKPWFIKTQPLSQIGGYKAISGGTIITRGSDAIISKGVCWTRSLQLPTISLGGEFVTNEGTGIGDWSSTISGLAPRDTIQVRSYIITRNGTFYGQTEGYRVPLETTIPSVVTNPVPDVNARKTSALLSGRISTDGGADLVEYGFWLLNTTTQTQQYISLPIVNPDSVNPNFDTLVSGLTTNTTYEVKAYVRNKDFPNRQFGLSQFFFTDQDRPDAFPVVSTNDTAKIMDTLVIVRGMVIENGDYDFFSKGVCYGTGRNPSYSGLRVEDLGPLSNDSIRAEIRKNLLVPGIRYYFRAFARNDAGVGYGKEASFILPP